MTLLLVLKESGEGLDKMALVEGFDDAELLDVLGYFAGEGFASFGRKAGFFCGLDEVV